jgi:hypothetical protein
VSLPELDIYLELGDPPVRPFRPYLQGDIFLETPMSLIKRFKQDPDYAGNEAQTMVALLGHPCASYSRGSPIPIQSVAEVRRMDAAAGGRPFAPPWDSHTYLFPLPGLRDGEDYVVDFRRIGTTHVGYLDDHRIACLSHGGWAAFQRRYAFHSLRAQLPADTWLSGTVLYWNEFEVWERWAERGLDPPDYQTWLDQPMASGQYSGTLRRELLEYAPDQVEADLP